VEWVLILGGDISGKWDNDGIPADLYRLSMSSRAVIFLD